ncbi:HYC_CC_PP family protein [Flavobacterium acetivorans]|uniref:HYC_CC_PP family protein n=1 Tax=Flavobacterium acetivorans TaxID=2893883 RepID=UPI001E60C7F4|nr:hypothetical protein [Flavobacterium sp. F-29]UFH36777.1 hypothetical protein LNP19_06965 [Flavobacterium sp. F-29]
MKLKRHISLLLAIFLLVSNLGLAVNVHYCGGEIASVAPVYFKVSPTGQSSEEQCCTSVSETNETCCKDKLVDFQKKSDHFVVKTFFFSLVTAVLVPDWSPLVFPLEANFKVYPVTPYVCDANAPPFFKLYHQYIFYA